MRRPSRAAVVRALRRWARETGRPPRASDWREPGGKWEREYPAWPAAGRRARALRVVAAGARRRRAAPAPARVDARADHSGAARVGRRARPAAAPRRMAALRRRAPALRHRHPAVRQLDGRAARPRACPPSATTGRPRRSSTGYGRSNARTVGRRPRGICATRAARRIRPPAPCTARSARTATRSSSSAGQSDGPAASDREILDALRAYTREHGAPPTCAAWRAERRRPSASVIIRRHGSWSAALAAAVADTT